MKLQRIKIAILVTIPLLGFLFLPADVAAHFNADGDVDGHMPKDWFILIFTMLAALLSFGIPLIQRALPEKMDARIKKAISLYALAFGVWMLLLMILVILANSGDKQSISMGFVWLISLVLLTPLAVLVKRG